MKEIKAYVRTFKVEEVIRDLETAGVPGVCVIDVNTICFPSEVELEHKRMSLEYGENYHHVSKLEIVCQDADTTRFVDVIQKRAYTSHKGDGYIFVSEIKEALKIRTGERDDAALQTDLN